MDHSLKDYFQIGLKITGLFSPTRYIWRPFGTSLFGEILEVDRCVADGELVLDSQRSLSRHLGHSMRGPIKVTFFEMIKIWLRIIR